MNTKKLMTLLLAVVLVLSLAACGAKGGDHMDQAGGELTNWQGDNIRKGSSNVLASNKNIHQHLLSCLDNNI